MTDEFRDDDEPARPVRFVKAPPEDPVLDWPKTDEPFRVEDQVRATDGYTALSPVSPPVDPFDWDEDELSILVDGWDEDDQP